MARSRKSIASSAVIAQFSGVGGAQRLSFLLMLVLAVGLLFLSFIRPGFADALRTQVTDIVSPVIAAIATPVTSVARTIALLGSLAELRAENERLTAENERLREYQAAAMRLEAENRSLRALTVMKAEPARRTVSARVIAEPGGPFTRNIIITAGTSDGVRDGLAVMAGGGLVGRVVAAGRHSARVLLISDINARVPVVLETSRKRAMLSGNNSNELQLTHLQDDTKVKAGDRLITSGAGGIYPPGLPVGAVIDDGVASSPRVAPLASLGQLEVVQVIDPGTPPDLLSPEATRVLPALVPTK